MKEINIINLDNNDIRLLPEAYNIGFTQFSSLLYLHYDLDGIISFAGSYIEFNNRIIFEQSIPKTILDGIMRLCDNENYTYTLHSETADFSNKIKVNTKILTLPIEDFDYDIYAIYSINIMIDKLMLDEFVGKLPSIFKMCIISKDEENIELLLNISQDVKSSVASIKEFCV